MVAIPLPTRWLLAATTQSDNLKVCADTSEVGPAAPEEIRASREAITSRQMTLPWFA
jgi:hypothetical protein